MSTRAGREALTRDRVLAAAVDLADREGVQVLTMRRLAAEVGVEAMSLYHHLPGKEGLLDGLVETVVAEIAGAVEASEGDGDRASDWRRTVRHRCLTARTVMLRHPWAPALIASRTSVPLPLYLHFEGILATMVEGGVSYQLAHKALHALGSMALGFAQELFSPAATGEAIDPDQAEAELAAMAEVLPHVTAMVASEIHANDGDMLGWCDSQEEFEFTLDLLLDGLARHAGQT